MSISLILRSVNDKQASALREGIILPENLITAKSTSYDGAGDITHLGCGCGLTLIVIFTIFLPMWNWFGWKTAIILASIFEIFPIYFAWSMRKQSRIKVDLKEMDPLAIVPDDCELCLYQWQGLHFLFTGSDWEGSSPENFLLHGGDLLSKLSNDGEYGPPRMISSGDLSAILSVLKRLNLSEAVARLEQDSQTTLMQPGHIEKENLESEFQNLYKFLEKANEVGNSVMIEMG